MRVYEKATGAYPRTLAGETSPPAENLFGVVDDSGGERAPRQAKWTGSGPSAIRARVQGEEGPDVDMDRDHGCEGVIGIAKNETAMNLRPGILY